MIIEAAPTARCIYLRQLSEQWRRKKIEKGGGKARLGEVYL